MNVYQFTEERHDRWEYICLWQRIPPGVRAWQLCWRMKHLKADDIPTPKEYKQMVKAHRESPCSCRCLARVTETFPDDNPYKGERYMLLCQCCDRHDCPVHYPKSL